MSLDTNKKIDSDIARQIWRAIVVIENETFYMIGEKSSKVELPNFSTDLTDAYRILKLIQSKGFAITTYYDLEREIYKVSILKNNKILYSDVDKTLPMAICVTALGAKTKKLF